MAELKTHKTKQSAAEFIASIEDEAKRLDSEALCRLMQEVTDCHPAMWGANIIGFDEYTYQYESGRSGTWPMVGFSPRKQNLTVYIIDGFDAYDTLLQKLGPHTLGKSCLYLKRLGDIDIEVLRELIRRSIEQMRAQYPKK